MQSETPDTVVSGIVDTWEAGLRAFMEASIEGFLLFDQNLNLIGANPVARNLLNISEKASIGKCLIDIIPGIDKAGTYLRYFDVVKTGEIFIDDDILVHTESGDKHLCIRAFKAGNGLGMICTGIPEPDWPDKLRKDEEYLQTDIIQNAVDGVVIIQDEVCVFANRAIEKITGYSAEELNGVENTYKIVPDDIEPIRHRYQARMTGEEITKPMESAFYRNDNTLAHIEVSSRVIQFQGRPAVMSVVRDITKRKQVEEALRSSEERFRRLSEAAEEGVVIHDRGTITEANEALARMLRCEVSDIIGMRVPQYVTPESWEVVRHHIASGYDKPYEFVAVRTDGSTFPCEGTGKTYEYEGNTLRVVTLRNITERKQVEEALRSSEEHFRALIENSHDVIVVTDKEGNITYESPSIERILGYKPEDLIGKNGFQFIHSDDVVEVYETFSEVIAHPENTHSIVLRIQHMDGSWRFVEAITQNLLNDPIVTGIIVNFRDITDRRQAEEDLTEYRKHLEDLVEERTSDLRRSNEQLWQEILERKQVEEDLRIKDNAIMSSMNAIGISELNGKMVYINPSYVELWGYDSTNEIIGNSAREFLKNKKAITSIAKALVKDGAWQGELVAVKKDGSSFDAHISASVIRDDSGEVGYFMSSIIDVTERKRIQKELQRLYKSEKRMRGQIEKEMDRRVEFTRALVHELKTPLTPMVISSQVLTNELTEEPLLSLARNVSRGATNLNNRIDELIDLTKGEIGILKLNIKTIDLSQLLGEVADYVSPIAVRQGQSLVKDWPSSLPLVRADVVRLRQVILNLLNNALRYTPEGGMITLRAREEDNDLIVEVQDTGPGITEDSQQLLFDQYQRMDSGKEHLGGLGLGLVLCKTLVELHGGKIWVNSQKGKGSMFTFSLPLINHQG